MKERPILFSAPMVRALLDGSKTQTRRALRVQPLDMLPMEGDKFGREWIGLMECEPKPQGSVFRCKFGVPRDRLYVRETWAQPTALDPGPTLYRADYPGCVPPGFTNLPGVDEITWRPSIHMPRALSRILLEVVSVRVERLNDVSEADAKAEGCTYYEPANYLSRGGWSHDGHYVHETALASFEKLWESINGAGSWAANPFVWAVEFKRVTP